jgi:nucleoside-diphosphate-sugar epimerase
VRVFVAGATGAVGRPLVAQLVAAGHEVTGTTRSADKAAALRAAGAQAAVCDALDARALGAAVAAARPEAVVHELTDLPAVWMRDYGKLTAGTNRLRRDGTRNLVDAARAAGTRRLVAQSLAFVYAPDGDWVKDEDAPLISGAPPAVQAVVDAVRALERAVLEAPGIEGIVLRYGQFYGPGTWYAPDGSIGEQVRARRFPIVGRGEGRFSFIHVDDAAAATVAAIERGRPGVYNVCDDEPAPMREWLPAYADAFGAGSPRRVPAWLARLAGGPMGGAAATMRGASNARARAELRWTPRYASWREGFREALG